MELQWEDNGFTLAIGGRIVLRHTADAPALFIGSGRAQVAMHRGNFAIDDRLDARIPLVHAEPLGGDVGRPCVLLAPDASAAPRLALRLAGDSFTLEPLGGDGVNRLWLRLHAEPDERCWGAGEQLSYFNLRGRRFPLWTSEPGVGRDKRSPVTFMADATHAGGDYWNTNYPQPTFVSSRRIAVHIETTAYAAFDFRDPGFHEVEVWAVPERIEFFAADSFAALVSGLSTRFGRQPRLPDWAFSGAILGLKDGERSFARLDAMIDAGAAVSGLWCEDWVGLRETSFGKRLFWDWKVDEARYPALRERIAALRARGIRFMGYVNPYLAIDGTQFPVAAAAGYLARRSDDDTVYLVDFGEFEAGVVDFTNPDAARWFADAVIGRNMLDLGMAGWMADFGEYLPTDVRLHDGSDGMLMHNAWPTIWAKVNAEAVGRRGRTGDAVFFMRAGFTGVGRYCPLLWAGDQSVDFSRHDGIGTVVTAALSSGLVGNAYHHADLGGYTSLFDNVRTPELLMRWSELSAFSPVMRSHEGNRPGDNLQLDGSAEVLSHFARMSQVHAALAPYVASLCDAAVATGLPLQRPLFIDHEADQACWDVENQYGYGPDLIVAPVLQPDTRQWTVYLPCGTDWVHLWSHRPYDPGVHVVDAPLGAPPVFYRADSLFRDLFAELARRFAA